MPAKSIYKPEYQVLLKMLREMRDGAGLNQDELAALLSRPQSYVSNVERGRRRQDLLQLRDHCQACGQDLTGFVEQLDKAIASEHSRVP